MAAKKNTPKNKKNTKKNTPKNVKTGTIRSSKYDKNGKRTHKKCSVCGKWKAVEKYYRPDRDCRCKDCSSAYAKNLRDQKNAAPKKNKRKAKAA